MPKVCDEPNCTNNIFGGGKCLRHQWKRKDKPTKSKNKPSVPLSPRKRYIIPKQSETRKKQSVTYKEVKDEIITELKAQGKYDCFFCTKPMGKEKGFHHLKGRDGDKFIDKKYLVPGHSLCHVFIYHPATVEQLLKIEWYQGFLNRLKSIDLSLYREELKKQEKAGILFGD